MSRAIKDIEDELRERLQVLEGQNKLVEAQRLRMRTTYDLEMMQQMGFCNGIENYSRHIDGRGPRHRAALPPGLLPGRLPAGDRRIPRHRAADRRDVRRRHVPQAQPGGLRLPAAVGDGQPAAEMGRVPGARSGQTVYLSATPGQVRARQVRRLRPADHPAHRPGRSRGHRQAHQGPDRRPAGRDPDPHGWTERTRPGHHADQADGRGPDRLPHRARREGRVPALRRGHAAPRGTAPRTADGRLRRPGGHQPAPRGPGPARGVAGGASWTRTRKASCARPRR